MSILTMGRTLGDKEEFTFSTSLSQTSEDLDETQRVDTDEKFNHVFIAQDIFIVTFIGLTCFLGNGFVIHIYRRKQGYAGGKMYIILFAII